MTLLAVGLWGLKESYASTAEVVVRSSQISHS